MIRHSLPAASIALIAIALLTISGCASFAFERGVQASNTFESTAAELDAAKQDTQEALRTLDELVAKSTGDLRSKFQTYNGALGELEGSVEHLRTYTDRVVQEGAAYFATWDAQLATIQNEKVRERSETRRKDVNDRFEKTVGRLHEARDGYGTIISDLRDIRQALAIDLTVGGAESVRDLSGKVRKEAGALYTSTDKLTADVRSLAAAMQPGTPETAAPAAPAK